MKKTLGLLIFAVLCVVAITITGCNASTTETMSASERMSAFIDDVNAANWGGIKEHTSKTSAMYSTANDSFWETNFLAGIPWKVTSTGATSVAEGGGLTYTFSLVESDSDFFVIKTISNGTVNFYY